MPDADIERASASVQPEIVEKHPMHIPGIETSAATSLHRGLRSRQIHMIAMGGALGTGLLVSTGSALHTGGPASIFIAYSVIGFIVFLVMTALGEMAAWLPMSGGFSGFATRFVHPSLGFAMGWTYWFKYIITTPNQMTAGALVIQYWLTREQVNPGVWITVFLLVIIAFNYFGIRFFGELEFWLSTFKILVIIGLIILMLVVALGGGPNHHRTGFLYWSDPGAFNTSITTGSLGKFAAFWSTFNTATFAYLGTELIGVTVGEAQNPRKTLPQAIKLTFFRITIFYCLSTLLIGLCVPYNAKAFSEAGASTTTAAASPFVIAIQLAGIKILPHIINAAILIFVFSAANSDLYIASRTLYGNASNQMAPAIFRKTDKRHVPLYALGLSAAFCLLAYLNVSTNSATVFGYFVNLVTIFGLLTWISILISHICFIRARRAQGISDSMLPYTAPLGIWGSAIALFFCCLIALTKNYSVFAYYKGAGFISQSHYATFITGYLGIPLFLILLFGHMIWTGSKGIAFKDVDLFTGKDIIDSEEGEFLAMQEATRKKNNAFTEVYKRPRSTISERLPTVVKAISHCSSVFGIMA
ncbi:amino acid permease [Xylariaceae sp. FL0255]|nr:amino acid permease [Xylariaceae sp. FL0255]